MTLVLSAGRVRVLFVGLVLLHLAVISHQVDGGGGATLLQRSLLLTVSPLQRAVDALLGGAAELWRGWGFHRETYRENRRLQARLRELEAELQARSPGVQEAARLRELLELRRTLPLSTIPAQVVGKEGVPWFRTLTLDRGEADGVSLDAPVLSPTGVVGRVFAVGPHACRVQLLLDRDSGAGVMIERSRVAAVVSGQVAGPGAGADDLVLKYVPERADVVVGDLVVTSGLDRIYPKGLVVGRVRFVGKGAGLFRDIRVEPSAGFDHLEEVLVVRPARESLDTPRSVLQ
ncbi:MAG TPA: rod shape-determining protein MreC [Vicinamibacteria bacterium]|nr:rod shape-determining protein MreC [Vicinamibacteria bacterium]